MVSCVDLEVLLLWAMLASDVTGASCNGLSSLQVSVLSLLADPCTEKDHMAFLMSKYQIFIDIKTCLNVQFDGSI